MDSLRESISKSNDDDDDDSMSSGGKADRKMRGNKAGWEEAGAEFYQESYPAGSDWDQRDPVAIATLLPSKQNRFGKTTMQENYRQGQRETVAIRMCCM